MKSLWEKVQSDSDIPSSSSGIEFTPKASRRNFRAMTHWKRRRWRTWCRRRRRWDRRWTASPGLTKIAVWKVYLSTKPRFMPEAVVRGRKRISGSFFASNMLGEVTEMSGKLFALHIRAMGNNLLQLYLNLCYKQTSCILFLFCFST